jgi:hypothetical protein
MMKLRFTGILALLALCLSSCKDIFEENISTASVEINSPLNNTITQTYSQLFWWQEVSGALNYKFQIVQPSFDSIRSLIVDTTVSSNKMTYSLDPGTYQWRIRAQNGSSNTVYTIFNIRVDSGSLANQTVTLLSPGDNYISNTPTAQFSWQGVYSATKYNLHIDSASQGSTFIDTVITSSAYNPTFSFSFSQDKIYYWKVRAENSTLTSQYSNIRSFTLDRVAPDSVTMPSSSSVPVASPVLLQWGSLPSIDHYNLYVYQANGVSLFSGYPLSTSSTSHSFSAGSSGSKLYWKVTAVDQAGNEGVAGKLRSFVVQ